MTEPQSRCTSRAAAPTWASGVPVERLLDEVEEPGFALQGSEQSDGLAPNRLLWLRSGFLRLRSLDLGLWGGLTFQGRCDPLGRLTAEQNGEENAECQE